MYQLVITYSLFLDLGLKNSFTFRLYEFIVKLYFVNSQRCHHLHHRHRRRHEEHAYS